ncbi:MAG: hypothetical protein AMXMBFR56_64000 [Polyangiaceae bacterium]
MKTQTIVVITGALALGAAAAACGGTAGGTADNLFTGGAGGAGNASGAGGSAGASVGGGGASGGGLNIGGAAGGGGGGTTCTAGPTEDQDQDGFTIQDGDCNDCDANANPGAYDVANNQVDEDCNGTPDDTPTDCDGAITDVADMDPMNGARAIGLCQVATPGDKKWGVLEAKWVAADGSPLNPAHDNGHGLLSAFGPNVNCQEGKRMLGLSSGTARQPTDPGYQGVNGYSSGVKSACPTGFPIESPSCSGAVSGNTANDPAGLELKIRVPTNAKSFSFNFNFYTYEWPNYVCTTFNDFFVALLNPATNANPPQYANISFDTQGNPVSVNNAFLEACNPTIGATNPGGKNFPCTLGVAILQGTGFDNDHAATGWLETVAPITPGSEMILRYAVWDAGDHILDSSVLVDNFKFSADQASNTPTTKPVPTPK